MPLRLPTDRAPKIISQSAVLAIAALVFAVYAPSLGHMLLYDDPLSIVANMLPRSLLGVFVPGNWEYRPVPIFLWNLVRDALGWYVHAPIHLWNVGAHVFCSVLVAALAGRLAAAIRWRSVWLMPLAALMFGLFPLSFQAVIWAGAIYHPAKAMFGLFGLHAYLSARERSGRAGAWRWLLSLVLLCAACLSHETGFVFGAFVIALEVWLTLVAHRHVRWTSFGLAAAVLAYPLIYRFVLSTYWADLVAQRGGLSLVLDEMTVKAAYFLQAFNAWLAVLLRPVVGLADPRQLQPSTLLLGLLPILAGMVVLWAARRAALGLIALALWLLDAATTAFLLDASYILGSPRMTYVGAIGISLFWAGVVASGLELARHKLPRGASTTVAIAVVSIVTILTGWSALYLRQHIQDVRGLTAGMKQLDADLRALPEDASVVLINLPHWSAPAYPSFLFGAEGDVIYIYGPSEWVGGVGGRYRAVTALRDDAAFVGNDQYHYQLAGEPADGDAVRQTILNAELVYRVEFDASGLRLRRLAQLNTAAEASPMLARFEREGGVIELHDARAKLRDGRLELDLTWANESSAGRPTAVFVHGFDAAGQQVLNADRDLIEGYLPVEQVPSGRAVREHREIALADGTAMPTTLKIGLYDRETGERHRAVKPDGTDWDEAAVVVAVQP